MDDIWRGDFRNVFGRYLLGDFRISLQGIWGDFRHLFRRHLVGDIRHFFGRDLVGTFRHFLGRHSVGAFRNFLGKHLVGDFRIFLARHFLGGCSDHSPRISGPFGFGQGWLRSATWLKVVVLARGMQGLR